MIVVDASVVIQVLLRKSDAATIETRLFTRHEMLHAPHLLDVEVTHALRRHALAGEMDDVRGREAIADLSDLPIRRHAHRFLLEQVWEWRENLTAYDATYVALADVLDATLLTRDRRLAAAVGRLARVELI